MKKLLFVFLVLVLGIPSCHAQFGALNKLYKSAKSITSKSKKQTKDDFGNKKIIDLLKDAAIDTTSVEYKESLERSKQEYLNENPQLKKMMELQGDTAALNKYLKEQYGGMTNEEIAKKMMGDAKIDFESKEFKAALEKTQKMQGISDDPLYKKIMAEGRTLTKEEATYFNEKYGVDFEYDGMEAYNDSVGVYAQLDGKLKPMSITMCDDISDERPVLDLGQNVIKSYVKDFIGILKKPFADREVVDSVQNYMIYNHQHAEEQFKGVAKFTIYSNREQGFDQQTVNDFRLRRVGDFMEQIDPKNIYVFKVRKGLNCRYMEYMYNKISYKQSELTDYVSKRLIDDGYIDAKINQKLSDDQLYSAMDKLEMEFKIAKLLTMNLNGEKFRYANVVPAAEGVTMKTKVREVTHHVTALEVSLEAEPGEYAFIIRNPEVEEYFKHIGDDEKDEIMRKKLQNFDVSLLNKGAFFFTIK